MDAGPLKMKNNATPHETPSLPLTLPSEVLETATLTILNYLTKCTIVFFSSYLFFFLYLFKLFNCTCFSGGEFSDCGHNDVPYDEQKVLN